MYGTDPCTLHTVQTGALYKISFNSKHECSLWWYYIMTAALRLLFSLFLSCETELLIMCCSPSYRTIFWSVPAVNVRSTVPPWLWCVASSLVIWCMYIGVGEMAQLYHILSHLMHIMAATCCYINIIISRVWAWTLCSLLYLICFHPRLL